METSDYIIRKLKSFIEKFSNTKVRYENDEMSHIHMIEILPLEVYKKNNEYIKWESDFFDEFINKFQSENICFISEDALVGIDKVSFEKEGIYYTPFSVEEKSILIDSSIVQISQKSANNNLLFTTCMKSMPESITIKGTNIPVEYTNYSYSNAA